MIKEKGRIIADYPPERPDWLLIEEYAKKKSHFGCLLCDKTHWAKDCEHKAKRTVKTTYSEYKAQYNYSGYGD